MALSLVTPPYVEPISEDEAKAHLRVDTVDEDALITTLIGTAREYVEAFTGRALISQTWALKLDAFPCDGAAIVLPKPPVTDVSSVIYVGTDGNDAAMAYQTDLPAGPKAQPGRLMPAYGSYYPATRSVFNAVTITFTCGYGDEDDVPYALKAAMLLLMGHWYANREAVTIGSSIVASLPMAVDALLWPYKVF